MSTTNRPDYAELERLASTEFTSQLALDDAERYIIRATPAILADVRRLEAENAALREAAVTVRAKALREAADACVFDDRLEYAMIGQQRLLLMADAAGKEAGNA